jgi:hypothetical protein
VVRKERRGSRKRGGGGYLLLSNFNPLALQGVLQKTSLFCGLSSHSLSSPLERLPSAESTKSSDERREIGERPFEDLVDFARVNELMGVAKRVEDGGTLCCCCCCR